MSFILLNGHPFSAAMTMVGHDKACRYTCDTLALLNVMILFDVLRAWFALIWWASKHKASACTHFLGNAERSGHKKGSLGKGRCVHISSPSSSSEPEALWCTTADLQIARGRVWVLLSLSPRPLCCCVQGVFLLLQETSFVSLSHTHKHIWISYFDDIKQ
jgi:hypothetical protein